MKIEYDPSFDFNCDAYRALYAQSNASIFQHPDWLAPLYNELLPYRAGRAVVITGTLDDGSLAFVLPMTLRTISSFKIIEAADLGVCDYCEPIVRTDMVDALQKLDDLQNQIKKLLPPHDILRIRNIKETHCDLWALFFLIKFKKLGFSCHVTQLVDDYEEWLKSGISKRFSKDIRKKHRRFYEAKDASLSQITRPDEVHHAFSTIAKMRNNRFTFDLVQDRHYKEFYSKIAVNSLQTKISRIYRLCRDGTEAGLIFGLQEENRFSLILLAGDYNEFGRYSPGILCCAGVIESQVKDRPTYFDFTIGDEPYKLEFGCTSTPIYGAESARNLRGWIGIILQQLRHKYKEYLDKPMKSKK